MPVIDELLKKLVQVKGSDLHIKASFAPHARVDGSVVALDGYSAMDEAAIKKEIFPLLSERKRETLEKEGTVEFSIEKRDLGARFRGSLYLERNLPAVTLRLIPKEIPPFESLAIPPSVLKLAEERRGLILVTGPTGSGKSTSLASMVDYINRNFSQHIVSLEDPIEFVHTSKKSLVSQREMGDDFHDFPSALRYVLRQDPDVIMVGELRDLDTVRLALQAAETGHLVLSTLHTVDAVQTISRMIDLFPPHEQVSLRARLSDLIKGVVALRLIRRKGGGRVPACEVMMGTPFVRKLIAENKLGEIPKAIEQGSNYGMQSFLQSLLDIYSKGWAELEECKIAASSPDDFMTRVRGIKTGTQ
ncbi:MAG: PilT/PilU family type 4a pilus ATPase [Elusimicrobia bacterium]|nr:PilT/PilU family type 4a pilus ATPase [Elusimicrobiota bacterium]